MYRRRRREGEGENNNRVPKKEQTGVPPAPNPRSFAEVMKRANEEKKKKEAETEQKTKIIENAERYADVKQGEEKGMVIEQRKEKNIDEKDIFAPFLDTPENRTKKEEEIREIVIEGGKATGWDNEKIMRRMTQKMGYPSDMVQKAIQSIPSQYKQQDIEEKIKEEKQKQILKQREQEESRSILGADGSIIPTWTEKERVFWQGRNMFLYKGKQIRTMNKIISIRKKKHEPTKGPNRIYLLFNKGNHFDDYGKKEFDLMHRILDWQPHPDPEKDKEGKTKADMYWEVPRHPRSQYYYLLPPKKPYGELIQENIQLGKIILGEGTDIHDKQNPITLPIHDLYTHELITGGTGKGKTTLLVHQALQLIAAGVNLFVFDPKGDLIDGILPFLPETLLQQNRVVIIDPYETELPVSINPLYVPGLEQLKQTNNTDKIDNLQGRLKEEIVDMLKRTTPVEGGTPSLDRNLRGIIGACLEAENTTLVDAYYIIKDQSKRWRLLNMLSKETNKYYVASQLSSSREDDLLSTENRLHPFFDNTVLKRMLCKRTIPLDFSKLVEPGMIVLIDLRKAKISSSIGKILGTVYAIQLWLTIISKKGTVDITKKREHGRFPTIAIMDEFQNFTTQSFTEILNEARSYNFGLIMATQYLSQIHPEMMNGLIENVALHIALGVGANDAKILKDVLGCKEKYLMRLDPFTFYGRAKVGAHTTKAFYGELYHPLRKTRNWELYVKLFQEHSREIYGRPYNVMDTSLFGTDVRQIEDMLKAVRCLQIKNRGKNSFDFDEVQGEMERIATMPGLLRVGGLVSVSKSCADQGLMRIDFDSKKAEDLPKNERFRAFKYSITQDGLAKIGVESQGGRSAAAGGPTHKSLIAAAHDLTLLLGGDMIVKNQDEGGTEYLPDGEVHVEPVMEGRTPSQQEKIRDMLRSKPLYDLSRGRDVNWEIESSTVGVREKIVHNFCKGLRENRVVFFGAASEQDGFRVVSIIDYFIREGYKTFRISDTKTYEKDTLPRQPTSGDYQVFVLSNPPMLYDIGTESFKKVRTTMSIGMDMLTFEHSKMLLPILEKIISEKKNKPLPSDVSDEEKQKTLNGSWDTALRDIYGGLEERGLSSTMSKQDVLNTMKKLGVDTLNAPTGHVENTMFTITQENMDGIKNTLEEEEDEAAVKKTEMKKEYEELTKKFDTIQKQIDEGGGTAVYTDEDNMGKRVNMSRILVHRFLQYGGASKAEDGKIMVTAGGLKQMMGNYERMISESETEQNEGTGAALEKEDITYHQLLGLYDEHITAKKIGMAGRMKHNINDFLVETGEYNISSDVMKKFNELLSKHIKEIGGITMIKSSVQTEIQKILGESTTKKKLMKICDYIREKKGINEAGVIGIKKREVNTILNNNTENAEVIWAVLQEKPVPGGLFDTETGEIILSLEQFQEFEKQLPLIAQKYMMQEEEKGVEGKEKPEQVTPPTGNIGSIGVVGDKETVVAGENKNNTVSNTVCVQLPGKCFFCGKDLKTQTECTMTKKHGYVCLKCYDEQKQNLEKEEEKLDVAPAINKPEESMEGLTNEEKILKVLSANQDKLFTITEVSELTKIDYNVAGKDLSRLVEGGAVAKPNRGKYCYKEQEGVEEKEK